MTAETDRHLMNPGNVDLVNSPEIAERFPADPNFTKWTNSDLSQIAEMFYLGKLNAKQVASIIVRYSDHVKLKDIIQKRMKATADALCKLLDEAAFDAE